MWARLKNWERAAGVLQVGLKRHPSDITLGRSLSEVKRTSDVPRYATAVAFRHFGALKAFRRKPIYMVSTSAVPKRSASPKKATRA